MTRRLDPAVARAAAAMGIDTTGAGRHHPIAVESARRSGLNLDRLAGWTADDADAFAGATSSVVADGERQARIAGRLAESLAAHGVTGLDDLPLDVLAEAFETTPEGVPAARRTVNALLPADWWHQVLTYRPGA